MAGTRQAQVDFPDAQSVAFSQSGAIAHYTIAIVSISLISGPWTPPSVSFVQLRDLASWNLKRNPPLRMTPFPLSRPRRFSTCPIRNAPEEGALSIPSDQAP